MHIVSGGRRPVKLGVQNCAEACIVCHVSAFQQIALGVIVITGSSKPSKINLHPRWGHKRWCQVAQIKKIIYEIMMERSIKSVWRVSLYNWSPNRTNFGLTKSVTFVPISNPANILILLCICSSNLKFVRHIFARNLIISWALNFADVYGWILRCDQLFGERSVDTTWKLRRLKTIVCFQIAFGYLKL